MLTQIPWKFWLKKVAQVSLTLLLVLALWYAELIVYGLRQGYGQFKILWNTQPVAALLADATVPDSVKNKLKLILEIRQFAFDSLGLKHSDNYTTFYNTQGRPLLWVVTACEPYRLKAKEWDYAFLGKMSYKGFFEWDKAADLVTQLRSEGWEADIGEVEAWSTLGWFRDPVLSSMLRLPVGDLAQLIIHELTHGTLYIKDSVDYNENLADFVGDQGAIRFLKAKYGAASGQLRKHLESEADMQRFYGFFIHAAKQLDSLYKSYNPSLPSFQKESHKQVFLKKVATQFDTVAFHQPNRFRGVFRKRIKNPIFAAIFKAVRGKTTFDTYPKNTFFMSILRYRGIQNNFENEFNGRFGSNFPAYLSFLKKKYAVY